MRNPSNPSTKSPKADSPSPADVDARYNRAKAAGAAIVEDLHETIYGRQYGTRDLDGHHWLFSTHAERGEQSQPCPPLSPPEGIA
jgi:uncharacterized glyoxalase superfamily protein PhnB